MDVKTINNYVLDNNELDLEQIIEDYSNYIYIIIRNMTSNLLHEEDIEELISDVLFVVWKNKEKIERKVWATIAWLLSLILVPKANN